MNLSHAQYLFRPRPEQGWHAAIPLFTVLVSGLVIILSIDPTYLRELHPVTLLLLSIACALPVWACNQLLWWHIGRRVSAAIVASICTILDVPDNRSKVYKLALTELLKALDVLRFVPYKEVANMATVVTIYLGAALCYLSGGSQLTLAAAIFSLSLFVWVCALAAMLRAIHKLDVQPLQELWREAKNRDEFVAAIHTHLDRMERRLLGTVTAPPVNTPLAD
ncbi:MAG: hypothetical protein KDI17_10445 [Halioglobus sp.]|nr:hypothetical protein [Halioglobus sp.]